MKRTVQMHRSTTPTRAQASRSKGHKGVGKPKREWRPSVSATGLAINPVYPYKPNRKPKRED
jgi:hypothetical protein